MLPQDAITQIKSSELPKELRQICLDLAEWISASAPEQLEFLTLPDLGDVPQGEYSPDQLLRALSILSTSSFAILDVHGFINNDEGPMPLDDNDFKHALKTGELVHPDTGDLIEDARSHIFLYYTSRKEDL